VLLGVAGAGFAAGIALAGLVGWTFSGMGSIEDGQVLPDGAIVVEDGYVSAFLVPLDGGRVALVDAGNDPSGAAIHAALQRQGRSESDVVAVLLTHGHPDHTAACARFPSATVYAGEPELPVLAGTAKTHGPLPGLFGPSPSPCRSPVGVTDGQAVDLGGKEAHAYAIPGHTAGSTAWRIDGVVFLGDGADATAGGELVGAKWVFSDDVAQSERSLSKLSDQVKREGAVVDALACAHSGTLPGVALERFAATHR
jgi:glyoxylase-like metal-dependent hydrolase (beta-lactamase superfamily II)